MFRFHHVCLRALTLTLAGTVTIFWVTGCDLGGGNSRNEATLEIRFQRTTASNSSSGTVLKGLRDSVVVEGSNGQLTITELRFTVEEFELKANEDSLDFDAPPRFVDLPLNATDFAPAGNFTVDSGTYFEFEFEVDDLDPDGDDSSLERQQIEELLNQIREEFPNFPSEASMIVEGSFTPEDGEARGFTSYIEAEIEVEREFDQPLEVTEEGFSRSLTVRMDPGVWFRKSNGSVRNLAEWQSTDDLLEIEEEFKDGVVEIEIDDD